MQLHSRTDFTMLSWLCLFLFVTDGLVEIADAIESGSVWAWAVAFSSFGVGWWIFSALRFARRRIFDESSSVGPYGVHVSVRRTR